MRFRTSAALACVLVLGVLAGTAFAAPAPATAPLGRVASDARLVTPTVEVQVWPSATPGSATALIVVGTLPTSTPLPATIRLPLPAGAKVTWSGEITGGTAQQDIQRPFAVVDGKGGKAVEITAEKTRIVQYEADYPAPVAEGGLMKLTLHWVQTVPGNGLHLGARLPVDATNVKTDPAFQGTASRSQTGEQLFLVPPRAVALGASIPFSIQYATAASGASGATGAVGGSDLLLPILLGVLAVVVIALLFIVLRQRRTGTGQEDAEEPEDARREAPDVPEDDGQGPPEPPEEQGDATDDDWGDDTWDDSDGR